MKKHLEKFSEYYLIFCVYALIGWLYEVFWMWFVVPPKHFINRGVLLGPFLPIYGFGILIILFFLHNFMKKKHSIKNLLYLLISVPTVVSFIYITIIEYTTPKIYHVDTFFQKYGLGLLIINIICILLVYILSKTIKKEIDVTPILVFLFIWLLTTFLEYVSHYAIDKGFNKMLWDYSKDFLNINKRVNWDASRNFAIVGTFALYIIQPLVIKIINKLKDNKIKIALVIGIIMLLDFILHVLLKII